MFLFLPVAIHLERARKHMETFHVIYCSKWFTAIFQGSKTLGKLMLAIY